MFLDLSGFVFRKFGKCVGWLKSCHKQPLQNFLRISQWVLLVFLQGVRRSPPSEGSRSDSAMGDNKSEGDALNITILIIQGILICRENVWSEKINLREHYIRFNITNRDRKDGIDFNESYKYQTSIMSLLTRHVNTSKYSKFIQICGVGVFFGKSINFFHWIN